MHFSDTTIEEKSTYLDASIYNTYHRRLLHGNMSVLYIYDSTLWCGNIIYYDEKAESNNLSW